MGRNLSMIVLGFKVSAGFDRVFHFVGVGTVGIICSTIQGSLLGLC